ncbi:ribonuclease 3-like protein 2 [Zingiber officinale]|uniref:Uncharacterized protein n=1 Tax=Zingiber officinale TaxID=94328 RepID=A0A8J5HMA4_ZINOF|nr:ribonuclease 3-like protein 2 [Zingiber officinale]KAG6519471.1 hypothetical protein ZIOFF_022965 [Zingiber officinale]
MEPSSSRQRKVAIALDIGLRRTVAEIESILGYTFRNKSLLVEAITHGSYAGHPSYQRLEFVGDAVLGLAVSHYLYERYPDIGSGDLTALRRANVSNEKLSRVAVRFGLYRFLRRNSPGLDQAVSEFTDIVTMEEEEDDGRISFGGSILKARAVLADMVESIAAAVYWDCDSNLKVVWKIFSKILTPIITLETMKEQPVAALNMLCQKQGKALEFRSSSFGSSCTVSAFVDGKAMGTGTARQMEIAKLNAARDALPKLSGVESVSFDDDDVDAGQNLHKQRLYTYCGKKRWMKPLYKIDKEEGPAHNKKFICSVTVGSEHSKITRCGDPEPKVRYAENSAARHMLSNLQPDEERQPPRIVSALQLALELSKVFFDSE